jgi:hypothetical protein
MYNMNMESIPSFDLEKEQWRPATLHGPPEINIPTGAYRHKLAELSHTLVMITYHVKFDDAGMDFWFAEDLEKGIWVKKHTVRQKLLEPCLREMSLYRDIKQVKELDDGRIVFSYFVAWAMKEPHWTRVYDPRTKAYTNLPQLGGRTIVGVYTKKPSILHT